MRGEGRRTEERGEKRVDERGEEIRGKRKKKNRR